MAWAKTWTHTIAIAIDVLAASIFWNRSGVTVSSLCWRAMRGEPNWRWRLLARFLERIDPGHLEGARRGDIERAISVINLLR